MEMIAEDIKNIINWPIKANNYIKEKLKKEKEKEKQMLQLN